MTKKIREGHAYKSVTGRSKTMVVGGGGSSRVSKKKRGDKIELL